MNRDSKAILFLCSHLCTDADAIPLQPHEWSALAVRLKREGLRPGDLLTLTAEEMSHRLGLDPQTVRRYTKLLDRAGKIESALSDCADMGIYVVTRADESYPPTLKRNLGNRCPPLFYCAGNPDLFRIPCAGYVGTRQATAEDIAFIRTTVPKTLAHGYGVVTGGAVGVDQISAECALVNGGIVVEYPAGFMLRRMSHSVCAEGIHTGRWLLASISAPDVPFRTPIAMMRNQLIYAHSYGTVVVHAGPRRGGTWSGATRNLRENWCPCLCRDYPWPGNQALIARGAIPVTEDWDGDLTVFHTSPDDDGQISFDL